VFINLVAPTTKKNTQPIKEKKIKRSKNKEKHITTKNPLKLPTIRN
jgi:hypothetical protein